MRFLLFVCLVLRLLLPCSCAAALSCQNGGTYDDLIYMCHCPTGYHGRLCESSFTSDDPCDRLSTIPTLTDATGAHRVGNTQECVTNCVDFSSISTGWYKLNSPAGSHFITDYACLNSSINCGSSGPFVVHNLATESNPNRPLAKGYFHMHASYLTACYNPSSTALPVRILDCTTVKLYFLIPTLSSRHHYCIGDRKTCAPGLTSSDGFEPCYNTTCIPALSGSARSPVLSLDPITSDPRFFRCRVFGDFQAGQTVQYRVKFHLRFLNSTEREIASCEASDVSIVAGGFSEFACETRWMMAARENVYGGTVHCSVQARCTSDSYNTRLLTSNPHRFEFNFTLFDNATGLEAKYISVDRPVQICFNMSDVPVAGSINFRVTAGRQGVIPSDRIALLVARQYSNGTSNCDFGFYPNRGRSQACITFMLNNRDIDGWIPTGMQPGQQVAQLKLNISYSSAERGLDTSLIQNGDSITQWVKLYERQLIVNLSSLYTVDITTYAHAYIDPFVKAANSDYSGTYLVSGSPTAYYQVLKHKLLPYEVQIAMYDRYTTQVAVRYGYYVITIQANPTTGAMETRVQEKLPSGVTRNPLPLVDGFPLGVKVHNIDVAVRVRFELYSTVMFVYKFQLPGSASQCKNNFLMWSADFDDFSCPSQTNLRVGQWDALDLTLTAGFFDTPSLSEGLIFARPEEASNFDVTNNDARNLFSGSYAMPAILDTRGEIQPTQLVDLCSCDSDVLEAQTCLLNAGEVSRSRRSASSDTHGIGKRSLDVATPVRQMTFVYANATGGATISQEAAAAACADYVTSMRDVATTATAVCSSSTGPVGSASFVKQFQVVCQQYAVTLGTFAYTKGLYKDFFSLCYKTLSNDVQQVQTNPQQLETLLFELCPSNCSGHGVCSSAQCTCSSGYTGDACDKQVPSSPAITGYISTASVESILVATTSSSAAKILSVWPALSAAGVTCHLQSATARFSDVSFQQSADHMGDSSFRCSLSSVIGWLTSNNKMYMLVQIRLKATSWESSNHLEFLVYQPRCGTKNIACDLRTKTCNDGTFVQEPEIDGNTCSPPEDEFAITSNANLAMPNFWLTLIVSLLLTLPTLLQRGR